MTVNKVVEATSHILVLALREIKNNNDSLDYQGAVSSCRSSRDNHIWFDGKSIDAVRNANEKIAPLLGLLPKKVAEQKLMTIVADAKETGGALGTQREFIMERLFCFIDETNKQGLWEFVHAVKGIHLEANESTTLGCCRFYTFDQDQFVKWGQRMASGQYDPPHGAPILDNYIQHERNIINATVASVRVQMDDHDHAEALSKQYLEESLNVLRLSLLQMGRRIEDRYPPSIGNELERSYFHSMSCRVDRHGFMTQQGPFGGRKDCRLGLIKKTLPFWNEANSLLLIQPKNRNDIQKGLFTFLEWIGNSAMSNSDALSFVSLVTAFEALLIDDHESSGKKPKLAKRISSIINTEAKNGIKAKVENIYEERCKCLHDGSTVVSDKIYSDAAHFAISVFDKMLKEPSLQVTSYSDLLAVIDQ